MPALSPTMEKGNLAKWLKKEGDTVKSGDIIAEIETDKATMEVEAVDEGTIAKIVVPEGTADVPVNQVIAVLAGEGEDVKAAASGAGKGAPAPKPQAAPAPQAQSSAPKVETPKPAQAPAQASAPAAAPKPQAAPQPSSSGDRIFASPLAKRLAKEAGVDIGRIQGSGPHGRVIARDVEGAKSGKGMKPSGATAAAASAPAHRAVDVGCSSQGAVRRGQLRGRAARRHAPHDRAAADAVGADHPAFLPDDGLQHRQAHGSARGDQRRRAKEQGRQAGLQAFGQRFRHQGAGARAAAHSRCQRELDRKRHAQAQAFRCRRRGGDAGRPDHADHPPCREQVAVHHLQAR